ncbi:probable serine/threonine-protein kinase pats1 [Saccostrea cucullata]|uniref:probable serine/threonine-protein kinase pats1 n=1 Tax=Saccostrea cuccullata TaxID=36930 RepID=UPI002ED1990D
MFRARGMIVGCAGAGKTTLLRTLHERARKHNDTASAEKRTLLRKFGRRQKTEKDSAGSENAFLLTQRQDAEGMNEDKPTESTVGLEVHEDMFVIEDNKLKDFCPKEANSENQYLDNKLISMTDFAGQVAYYACHQVYLSRRAFYIVVVDMSKNLNEICRLYDTDRHNPAGSLFHSWTYGDYFHFWLQTINTYCSDGITQRDLKDRTAIKDSTGNVNHYPVILVGSHKDKLGGILQLSGAFYGQLEASLSKEQTLKRLISPYRYFEVECPPKRLSPKQQISIDRVKTCIAETVQKLPHWGEEVPLKWFELEKSLNQKKANGEKVLKWSELKDTAKAYSIDADNLNDVLRFLHEIGKIIYFSADKLKDTIIIDVQWFVDAFKYIITDERHFARKDNINELVNTGRITGQYIEQVWESIKDLSANGKNEKHQDFLWQSYLKHKDDILLYMDKLGLVTRIEAQVSITNGEEVYYIPSMNRTDLPNDKKDAINRKQKSAMMVYFFKSYLPHFFFFRLVVNCLKKWEVFDEQSFFKNAAFYKAEDAGHYFAIAVSKTSIQLQVFTRDETVKDGCVKKIRKIVEDMMKEITETFHKGIIYDMGFSCKDIKIADEDETFFLKESEIIQEVRNSMEMSCPRHFLESNEHIIDTNKIRMCLLERN